MAARNSELVGRQLGNLLEEAMELGLLQDNIHLIGHSLGAHIANFAVYWLRYGPVSDTGFMPGRITGIDD